MGKKYTVKGRNIVQDDFPCEAGKGQHLTQKQVCGMWLQVGIPYMVKSGRSDKLDQWERDWYEETLDQKLGWKGNFAGD